MILVDTCGGNDKQRPQKPRYHLNSRPYLENLAAAGVQLEEVDFVQCTYLHADHVGWNTRLVDGRWVPTFPNAKYLFAKDEWAFWEANYKTDRYTDDPYYEDIILPMIEAGHSVLVDSDHTIDDWVHLAPSPGHTPGLICVHISSGQAQAVMSGDLMHHPLQCAEPDWRSCFCVDPAASAVTRREFLATHAETPTLAMPAHFPTPAQAGLSRPAMPGASGSTTTDRASERNKRCGRKNAFAGRLSKFASNITHSLSLQSILE